VLLLTIDLDIVAEWESNFVEVGDTATRFNHILFHNKATRQVMACSRARL